MDKDIIIWELIKKVEQLTQRLEQTEKEIIQLRKENHELKNRLSKYEHPKNSSNSSVPPSKDENRPKRNQSLREKSGRKPGGQLGREGNTLKMVANPDFIEKHIPTYCSCCGKDMSTFPFIAAGKRQVIDIPKIELQVTEHQIYSRKCTCGHETTSDFPWQANAPVSYGNNIESLIGYFHARQYIPFRRMQEFFNHVFHVPISEGGIHYLLNKLARKAQPAYDLIKRKLTSSNAGMIGSDETGIKVGGENHWAWVWQNQEATFISITDNRGQRSITENFENGFEKAVLVHDCWKSHFNTQAASHQICMAHLLRDLNYLTERYNHKWSRACKTLFKSALVLEKSMTPSDYYTHQPKRQQIERRLSMLLNYNLPAQNKEMITFQKRLSKYHDYIFTFLYRPDVPPDNNSSERAIRNIKIKQKVSGQFKSPDGAFIFALLRSITDTMIKNDQNVVQSLNIIANLHTD